MSCAPCPPGFIPCSAGTSEPVSIRFTLIGLIGSPEFQQCSANIEQLHRRRPRQFPKPFIRPMLEFDWIEYRTKARRMYGGKLWRLEVSLIIYANDLQLVSADEFLTYISQFIILPRMDLDFECLALRGVAEMYEKYMELGRKFVFLCISLNGNYIGSMMIMLYYDILPKTCKNFLRKCNSRKHGYRGTSIHRIMSRSWIQFADFTLPLSSMSNENYEVPHNRRGILSMCSNGPHTANKTQFFLTLESAAWMDYRYVAFGQVMQGEYVLKQLEELPTFHEFPTDQIIINNCGELNLSDTAMAKYIPRIEEYLEDRRATSCTDIIDVRDAPSVLLEENYRNLKYCYFGDERSNFPLLNVDSALFSTSTSTYAYFSSMESESEESEGLFEHRALSQESGDKHDKQLVTETETSYLTTAEDTDKDVVYSVTSVSAIDEITASTAVPDTADNAEPQPESETEVPSSPEATPVPEEKEQGSDADAQEVEANTGD